MKDDCLLWLGRGRFGESRQRQEPPNVYTYPSWIFVFQYTIFQTARSLDTRITFKVSEDKQWSSYYRILSITCHHPHHRKSAKAFDK